MKRKGSVTWFNEQKGFGFVRDEAEGFDVYVDWPAIVRQGFKTLAPGEAVEYELREAPGGRKARRVIVLEDARPALLCAGGKTGRPPGL